MAEQVPPDSRRCSYFFLYDGSKVRGEGDLTREGICYFYPEETPLDQQELICGQLAGVSRCVSELSFSPVRVLRLRRHKFAIRVKDDFFWALGCPVEVPSVSICQLLDQLISLFCFYNGSISLSYQIHSRDILAARWAQYLSRLQSGSTDLHHIFSCLKTIDSTIVDPLLLLKAALILQACQRCPLVLAGCILFRGRVVSTQMFPELTMKVMVHENETYKKAQKDIEASSSGWFGGVSSTTVFLTASELQYLQLTPVHKDLHSQLTPAGDSQPLKSRLSRTLSDVGSTDSDLSDPGSAQVPQKGSFEVAGNAVLCPVVSQGATNLASHLNGKQMVEKDEPQFHRCQSSGSDAHGGEQTCSKDTATIDLTSRGVDTERRSCDKKEDGTTAQPLGSGGSDSQHESPLIPMMLYLHRVKGLVLALLVEPHFLNDSTSMEEVYHSSLASLNGLEAHLRTMSPGVPGAQGPPGLYSFAHYDSIQSTLTTNLSAGGGAGAERPFVRAASLLHSHFCTTETLQEAIIRSASAAVYGTRTVAQETYFQQHGGTLRNSGIPNHQDSAFLLPSKARHRLQKHGVNLL
ncbi:BLOC-3 complex member HPS4 isoform X1 [Takifugu rubripes]|uniref:BLOC-3 complex member HPS4 isoform X1 n=1 Tax=Takifugu rubripes TaxID=31033 RepID=UPI00114605A3|nr:Hermansky-Pudlak syndrome 4 protein isoform X1 [Takifugu rubripes]